MGNVALNYKKRPLWLVQFREKRCFGFCVTPNAILASDQRDRCSVCVLAEVSLFELFFAPVLELLKACRPWTTKNVAMGALLEEH